MANENVLNKFLQPVDGEDNILELGGTVKTDVISELTSATGVTIDGVLLKDGAVTPAGSWNLDVATAITAFAGGGQGSAVALIAAYNEVTVCASDFDSVKLLTAVSGNVQYVKNSSANILSVFPFASDSFNTLAANLSIDVQPGQVMMFTPTGVTVIETSESIYLSAGTTQTGGIELRATDSAANYLTTITNASMGQSAVVSIPDPGGATGTFGLLEGAQTFAGIQTYGAISNLKATDAITAFSTGGQGSAVQLTSQVNRITVCAADGDSVKLPTAVPGMVIEVGNIGAKFADVFPITGDLIDALAINTAISLPSGQSIIFTCSVALKWKATPMPMPGAKFATGTDKTTFIAGALTGGASTVYTNTVGTPGSIATRTATQMFADDAYSRVGGAYFLRINNNQGTGTLTVTAGAGVTLTGTATIAINTFRDFIITYTSATALIMQQVGVGTDA